MSGDRSADSFKDALNELFQRLPMPLAHVLKRVLNGKSAIERHHLAYYLAEASLKLAAAVRIGLWLSKGNVVGTENARKLESLLLPSTGHWLSYLRDINQALGELPDAALLPLARDASELDRKHADWEGVQHFADKAVEYGAAAAEAAAEAKRRGVIGFFSLVVSYRNAVMGHAAQRSNAYYEEMGALLLEALCEVLSCPALFCDLDLVHARMEVSEKTGESRLVWHLLRGFAGMPFAGKVSEAIAGELYFIGPAVTIPLHPLVVYREDELGREQFGFLNGAVARRKQAAEGEVTEVRRSDYLDYISGETVREVDARAALTRLLSTLRGRKVREEDLVALENRTYAETPGEPAGDVVKLGTVIGGFELLGEIGRGAMGVVYKARQLSLGRVVALKVLPPMLASDAVTLKRFQNEIAVLARCDHPNIVKILSSGVDSDRYYYAMELVEGADLSRAFRLLSKWKSTGAYLREGHLSAAVSSAGESPPAPAAEGDLPVMEHVEEAPLPEITSGRDLYVRLAELFAGAAEGLQHLHDHGVIHRDIKPGNLILSSDGKRLVIMDLGLAKLADRSESLTRSDVKILGTLRYMPPEQLQRRLLEVDRRADVYSLCATLYELATGQPFFDGDSEKRLIQQVLNEEPVLPNRADRHLPKDFNTIIQVGSSKLPKDRYATAALLAADLHAFASDRPIAARPPGPIHRATLWRRRNKTLAAALATLLVILAATGVGYWAYAYAYMISDIRFYNDVTPLFAEPIAIGELSTGQMRARKFSMRVTRVGRHGKIRSIEAVDSAGRCTPRNYEEVGKFGYSSGLSPAARECRWEFDRDTSGRVMAQRAYNRSGHLMWTLLFTPSAKSEEIHAHYIDAQGKNSKVASSDAEFIELDYSKHSESWHEVTESYVSPEGAHTQVPSESGNFGRIKRFDSRGCVVQEILIGPDGKPMPDEHGVLRIEVECDALGNTTERRYFGNDDRPVVNQEGVHRESIRYDANGEPIELTYFDDGGRPISNAAGYHRVRTDYDLAGNPISWSYFDAAGKPVIAYGLYHQETALYDETGNRVEWAYFDVSGKPILTQDGFHRCVSRYDAAGNQIESSYFDDAGHATLTADGYHRATFQYDQHGYQIEVAYFGLSGDPVAARDGTHRMTSGYDARGTSIEWARYGVEGKEIESFSPLDRIRQLLKVRPPDGHLREQLFWLIDMVYAAKSSKFPLLIQEASVVEVALENLGSYLETGDTKALDKAVRDVQRFARAVNATIAEDKKRREGQGKHNVPSPGAIK